MRPFHGRDPSSNLGRGVMNCDPARFNRRLNIRRFSKKHGPIHKAIQEIENHPLSWSVILFGIYSKEAKTKQSEVVLIVTCIPSKEKEVTNFIKSLEHEYEINFSPAVLPMQELSNIKKDDSKVWDDLNVSQKSFCFS